MAWPFLKKLNTQLSYDPATPPSNAHPKELKTHVHTNTFTQNAHSSILYNCQKGETT